MRIENTSMWKGQQAAARAAQERVDEDNRKVAETNAFLKAAFGHSGGTSEAPAREVVDRILGTTTFAAPTLVVDELAGVRAENARHADACAAKITRVIADRDGVRLAGLVGTGDGGKITTTDVLAARAAQPPRQKQRREVTAAVAPRSLVERRSVFLWAQMVRVNEYGASPLIEDIVQTNPEKAAVIIRSGDKPPTLFESGDLPVFTASGIPPAALAVVAWPARHVIARLDNVDAAYLLNKFTPGPASDPSALALEASAMFTDDDLNREYKERVAAWWNAWSPAVAGDGLSTTWVKREGVAWGL